MISTRSLHNLILTNMNVKRMCIHVGKRPFLHCSNSTNVIWRIHIKNCSVYSASIRRTIKTMCLCFHRNRCRKGTNQRGQVIRHDCIEIRELGFNRIVVSRHHNICDHRVGGGVLGIGSCQGESPRSVTANCNICTVSGGHVDTEKIWVQCTRSIIQINTVFGKQT